MCWVRSPTWGAGGALAGPHWAPWKLSLQRQTHLTSYSKFPTCEQVPFQECVCTSTHWLCSFVTVIGLSYSLHKYTGHIYTLYSPGNSPGQNTGLGCHSLLQGIFPTQGSNAGLLHCRQILYQLSHEGNPRNIKVYPKGNQP